MKVQIDHVLSYDEGTEIVEIFGVKYTIDLFRTLVGGMGIGPVGTTFKIVARQDGALTLETVAPTNEEDAA